MAQTPPAGDSPRLELIERLIAALNARDLDGMVAVMHEDVELWPTAEYLPPGVSYHHRDGVRSMIEQGLPGLPGVQVEVVAFTEFEDRSVAHFRLRLGDGSVRDSYWVYTFQDGLVLRAEQYATHEAALAAGEHHVLTPRERQVFQLLARGFAGPEIAEQLVVSPETVRTHVQNGVDRLGASTRVQAVAVAIARGEIEP